jgi:nucleotide-binding universal stress UspA family protein
MRRPKMSTINHRSRSHAMYRKILVPIDAGSTSNAGIAEAVRLAQFARGRIRLLHVVEEATRNVEAAALGGYAPGLAGPARERGAALLEQARARVAGAAVAVDTAIVEGVPGRMADLVCQQAQAWGADVIVIGTHARQGVERLLMGSDAEQIARRATVPVMLVHAAEVPEGKTAQPVVA